MSVRCWFPSPIRFACSLAFASMVLASPAPVVAQDEALVGELARLISLADARQFDPAAFRAGVGSPDALVRRQTAFAVAWVGDRTGTTLLIPLLQDPDTTVRAAAAFGLGMLKDPAALVPLSQSVRQTPEAQQNEVHAEAVTAIAKIGGEAGANALAQIIATGSADPSRPGAALSRALLEAWRLGPRAPIARLLTFTTSASLELRWNAIYSLARLRAHQATDAFLAALADREPTVREIAVRALSRQLADSAGRAPATVTPRIQTVLNDADPHVRINALRALGTFRDSTLAPGVIARLSDPDLGVQVQAETTLGLLGGSAAATALAARVAHPNFAVRRQAVVGLAMIGAGAGAGTPLPATMRVLDQLARDPDERARRLSAEALAALPDTTAAKAPLLALLGDTDGRVVAQALDGLGRRFPNDTALAGRARRLLGHGDAAVRSQAADYLARHPSESDVDLLTSAYQRAAADSFNDARLSAVRALAAIARLGGETRLRVASRFLTAVPRAEDYLVRRLAADSFPDAAAQWGPAAPIATGRVPEEYRDIVRRYVLPVDRGGREAPQLVIETDRGVIRIALLASQAPLTVDNMLRLADQRYFDGARWHRVVPNFVVQDGDPRGDGWGGPGYAIRDEINRERYRVGTVGMALSGPDTGGSQFFITHSPQPHLDGTYTVFGRVVSGMDVVNAISQGDRIRSVHR
jgi:cyclophilin family peptidyl-prolyl cis-trans isomerase/HEAT repeat protein